MVGFALNTRDLRGGNQVRLGKRRAGIVLLTLGLFSINGPSALANTAYTGAFRCGVQYAAIQSYTQGYANHRIWTSYGGSVLKFRDLGYTGYSAYNTTSKKNMIGSHDMGDASAYASVALGAVSGYCHS